MTGCVARVQCLLSLPLSSKGGEGNGAVASEHRDACQEQRPRAQQAITTAEQAIALATAAGQPELADRNRQLLELYRAGKPVRETSGGGGVK